MLKKMLNSRVASFKYAFKGIYWLFTTQPNAVIHGIMTLVVLIGGFFFEISTTEWCFCIIAIALVISAEAFNSALEFLTDLVSPEYHELAGKAKDTAAAAVLILAFGAILIGFIVFLPKILALIMKYL